MPLVKFTAYVASTRELCQYDSNRQVIPRHKQTKFCAELHLECRTIDDSIDLEFLIRTEVPFARLTSLAENRDKTVSVGAALARRGIPKLAKYPQLQIYGGEFLSMPDSDALPAESECYRVEQDGEISDVLATQLREATTLHRDCTERFEKAKEYLTENTNFYGCEASRARSNARFVANYMVKSSTPFMGAWNDEKSSVLVGYVEDLIRRKNTGHPGYVRASDWIQSTLYSVHPSKLWHTRPF